MTVLTAERAKQIAPEMFGEGEPPMRCELCLEPWKAQPPTRTPYGPFIIWCCWPCSVKMAKHAMRKTFAAKTRF